MAKKRAASIQSTGKKTVKGSPAQGAVDSQSVPAKLQSLLERPETEKKVLKLLLSLDESRRRELFPLCQKWFREVKKNEWIQDPPGTFKGNELMPVAKVAAFCTGNLTEIKKLGRWGFPGDDDVVLEILTVRKPDWVEQFVELLLGRDYYWNSWRLCRELVRRGLCPKPDNPRYYTGMITGLVGRWSRGKTNALRELEKNPDLLANDIWRLFEYEGDDLNTLANVDRCEESNWSGALVALSKQNKLPRAKLLDSALGALELGFNHFRARWFLEFFDRLEPTDQELNKRVSRILDLIASPTPNVAQWAFEKLQQMLDRDLLDDPSRMISAAAPLLGGRHKKTVLQVLRLFEKLARKSDKAAREVCLAAAAALSHEKADVQKGAFQLIQEYGLSDDRELRQTVDKYASVAAATVKKTLQAWLASGAADDPMKSRTKAPAKSKPKLHAGDLRKFDPKYVELLSLEPLIAALQKSPSAVSPIPAAVFDGTDFPRLDPDQRLAPIENLDELLEILGRVIEDDNLIDDAERAVDGLARLHANRPDDFDKLIAPLAKRADKLLRRPWSPFAGQGVVGDICGLILAWKRGEPVTTEVKRNEWGHELLHVSGLRDEPVTTWHREGVPLAFMSRRMLDVCRLVTGNQPQQLLSAPTHAGGWIDAEVLVARINGLTADPPESDVLLALLRLAPDRRSSALSKLKPKTNGEWVDAVRHGLGARRIRIGKTAALWAAAARCRSPLEDDPDVTKSFPKLGPGAGRVARFETRFRQRQTTHGPAREFDIVTNEKLSKRVPTNMPSQLFQLNRDGHTTLSFHDIGTTAGSIRWLASMWPAAIESFFAAGAKCLGSNLDWWEAEWHNRCFMEPLLNADTPLLDMGQILLLCGLAAKEPGEHGLAVDITIQAIRDGRLGTDNLGRMFTTGVTSGHFNLSRLANRLQDIAGSSELHAYIVVHSTETAIGHADAKRLPRGFADILEMLAEIGTQLERGIEQPECRSFLENIRGSSKITKAARQLLSVETNFDPRAIISIAVESRIDRLQEWSHRIH